MTNALITDLTKISSLRVISSTSSMQFKGTHKKLSDIARELNIETAVVGSVERSGDRVRVSAQLVDANNDRNLWAGNYDRDLQDVLKLQDELASAVAREIVGKFISQDQSRTEGKGQTVKPEAYEAYLKGRYFADKESDDAYEKAIEYFQKSIDLDPTYAEAYFGLAEHYGFMAYSRRVHSTEAWLKSEDLIAKTLELDPESSSAHALSGLVKLQFHCDPPGAEKELSLALELNPNDMHALDYHSYYLLEMGRTDEAITEKKRVLEHDPVSVGTSAELGLYYLIADRDDEAIEQLQETLELDPNFPPALTRLGLAYADKQQFGQAVMEIKKAISLDRTPWRMGILGDVYARWGKREESLEVARELKRISKQRYVPPTVIAQIYARLEDKDQALLWLEKATKEDVPYTSDSSFDSLRSDPQFKVIEARIKPDKSCPDF